MLDNCELVKPEIAFVKPHYATPVDEYSRLQTPYFFEVMKECAMMITYTDIPEVADELPIVSTPNVCGGQARVRGTRIPVWGLEQARRQGFSNSEILEMYPHLRLSDLESAWDYLNENTDEINIEIERNQS